jgi:hypothetical protein
MKQKERPGVLVRLGDAGLLDTRSRHLNTGFAMNEPARQTRVNGRSEVGGQTRTRYASTGSTSVRSFSYVRLQLVRLRLPL